MDVLIDENKDTIDNLIYYLTLKLQKPHVKIVVLAAASVKFLAKYNKMTGSEKKAIAIYAMTQTIEKSSLGDYDKTIVIGLINDYAGDIIDKLVEFGKDSELFKTVRGGLCCFSDKTVVRDRVIADTRNLEEYSILKNYLRLKMQNPITPQKIISLVAAGVKFIQHYKEISGPEKKDLVIKVIKDLLLEILPKYDATELIEVLELFSDDIIDYFVDFGKNLYLKIKNRCCKKN